MAAATEVLHCEYRRFTNAEPCGKPTRRTFGDMAICSSCARTNGGIAEAFKAGEPARSASGNLASETENGRAVLMSYRQPIGIRRASDGAIFTDAHSYSPTTSQHQREVSGWRDGVSFAALSGLLGPDWWKTARVVETAPQYCRSAFCEAARQRASEARAAMSYRVKVGERQRPAHGYECSDDCPPEHGPQHWHSEPYGSRVKTEDVYETRWYEPVAEAESYRECLFPNVERKPTWERADMVEDGLAPADVLENGQHELTVDGNTNGHAFTLLTAEDPLTGRHVGVLCGLDYGRSDGRGTQLFAAILPADVYNVEAALLALNPFASRVDAYGRTREGGPELPADVKRQGDLFFRPVAGECRCPCHVAERSHVEDAGAPRSALLAEALKRAGILNADGSIRKRHGCHVAGNGSVPAALYAQACKRAADDPPENAIRVDGLELPDAGGRHVPTYAAINARRVTFARGMVRHPQHGPIMLKGWHRVERSRAVRAMSAELRQWRAGGQRGYAD